MLENLNLVYLQLFGMTAAYSHLIIRRLPNKAYLTIFGSLDLVDFIEIYISSYNSKLIIAGRTKWIFLLKNLREMTENVYLFVPNLIGKQNN